MLTSLRLVNFKNHADTLIEGLKPLSVFVGPNAVGKSSILEGAACIHKLCETRSKDTLRLHLSPLLRKGAHDLFITAKGKDDAWAAGLRFESNNSGGQASYEIHPESLDRNSGIHEAVGQALYLRLKTSQLKKPSYPTRLPSRLDEDGFGLATVIGHLMQVNPNAHQALTQALREIVPSVRNLRTDRIWSDGSNEHTADQLLFDTVDGIGVPASLQSDGTLYVLALLTVLSLDNPPRLLLLDDVETGLHPLAQRELVPLLKKLVGDGSRVQLMMTTHSAYIVDGLDPDEVWVCGRGEDDKVRVKPLADAPGVEGALKVLTTGELWNVRGESWVVGGE